MSRHRIARRERFCQEYVKDHDARAAAVRAGYRGGSQIYTVVSRLMGDARVRARIAALQEAIALQAEAEAHARAHVEAGWVAGELVKIARADPRKFFHADGTPKKVHELGDAEAAALSGFEPSGEVRKVIDRFKVLDLLGRYLGMWPKKPPPPPPQEVSQFEGMDIDEIERIRDRVGGLLEEAGVDLQGIIRPGRPE